MDKIAKLFPISFGNTSLKALALDGVWTIFESLLVSSRIDLPPQRFINDFPHCLVLPPGAPLYTLEKIVGDFNGRFHMGNHIIGYGWPSKAPARNGGKEPACRDHKATVVAGLKVI
jgi:hypothetical protein